MWTVKIPLEEEMKKTQIQLEEEMFNFLNRGKLTFDQLETMKKVPSELKKKQKRQKE
jgi:hypothetical protein